MSHQDYVTAQERKNTPIETVWGVRYLKGLCHG